MTDVYSRFPASPASSCSSVGSSSSEMSVSPAPSPRQHVDEEEAARPAAVKTEPWSPQSEDSWTPGTGQVSWPPITAANNWSSTVEKPDNWASPVKKEDNWSPSVKTERRSSWTSSVKSEPNWTSPVPAESRAAASPATYTSHVDQVDNARCPLSAGSTTTTNVVHYPPNPYRRSDPYRCVSHRSRHRRVALDASDSDPTERRRFQRAVNRGDCEAVRQMLTAGARVGLNRMDGDGWTPLHRAVRRGQLELVRLLVAHGADCRLADRDGWSPLHLATGHTQVLLYLLSLQP